MAGRAQANDNIQPTKERLKKAGNLVEIKDVMGNKGAGNRKDNMAHKLSDGSPLQKLHKRGVLSDKQFDAGDKYYMNWYLSGMEPSTTSAYNPMTVTPSERSQMPGTEKQADYRMRHRNAARAVGKEYEWCLSTIVLFQFETWEYARKRFGRNHKEQARASGTDILVLALGALVDYYGL